MKIVLVFFLCTIAVHSREYQYDKPNVEFLPEELNNPGQPVYNPAQQSTIIQGNFGKNYEVTMIPSTKIFETRLQQTVVTGGNTINQQQYQNQYANQHQLKQGPLTSPNPAFFSNGYNGNLQQQQQQLPNSYYSTINQQQQPGVITNQYSGLTTNAYAANAQQQHLNQYSDINQQQVQQYQHQQQGVLSVPQQTGSVAQQQYSTNNNNNNNNVQNSNNLLNDLINNHKYVSQSEASQLDVYPYKQLTTGNTRPFTRFMTKCDARGNCEQQNVADGGDFQHQQVLKQSRAKIETISDKCRGHDYSPNSLDSQNSGVYPAGNPPRGVSTKKGTDLRDRRLFPYSEKEIPQYPTN